MSNVFKPNKSSKEVIGIIVRELEENQIYLSDRDAVVNSFLCVFADALSCEDVPFGSHFIDDVARYFSDTILDFDIKTLDTKFSKEVVSDWSKVQKLRPELHEYLLENYYDYIYEVADCFLRNKC